MPVLGERLRELRLGGQCHQRITALRYGQPAGYSTGSLVGDEVDARPTIAGSKYPLVLIVPSARLETPGSKGRDTPLASAEALNTHADGG
jgi:hypothetical protein